jgi:heme exporter protein C
MLLMVCAFWLYSIAIALYRVRTIILEREKHAQWVNVELRTGVSA